MDIKRIIQLSSEEKLRWTDHILKKLLQRGISTTEVQEAISSSRIIEEYPGDYPYPSCLVLGLTINKRTLHVVCAINDNDTELWLITTYVPEKDKWNEDFSKRKENTK